MVSKEKAELAGDSLELISLGDQKAVPLSVQLSNDLEKSRSVGAEESCRKNISCCRIDSVSGVVMA